MRLVTIFFVTHIIPICYALTPPNFFSKLNTCSLHAKSPRVHPCRDRRVSSPVPICKEQEKIPTLTSRKSESRSISNPTALHMSSSPSLLSSMTLLMQALSESTDSITSVLSTTPPLVYFFCLTSAGFGIPVSEDAVCIFAGTILPTIWTVDPVKRTKLLVALYSGIVLSDFITFTIGRLLKSGILEPLRTRMNLQSERVNFCEDNEFGEEDIIFDGEEEEFCQVDSPELRKMDRILEKLEKAGDYAGFIIRFSVGMRTPMMLLTGFSGKVPFLKYALGTFSGALCSLSLQLLLGYTMRDNPSAVVGLVASVSMVAILFPLTIALITSISLMRKRYQLYKS